MRRLAFDQSRPQWQFVGRQAHGLRGIRERDPFHLEQNLSRTHNRNPVIRRALPFAHTSFSRLLGDRLIGEYPDPDLSATFYEAGHGHAASFDLTIGNPARLEHLQPEVTKRQRASAPGFSGHAAALLLAVLYFLWHQHKSALSF